MVTADEARRELARRELARRRAATPQAPQSDQMTANLAELSDMTRNASIAQGDMARFDALPTWQKPFKAADDLVRQFANGITFGGADRLAGWMNGTGQEAEEKRSQEAYDRAGIPGSAAHIGGMIAAPVGLAGQGVTLAGRLGTGAMTGAKGLFARAGLMGAEGEAYSAAASAASGDEYTPGMGVLAGLGGSVAGEALVGAGSKALGLFNKKPVIPSVGDLKAQSRAAYKRAEDEGVAFNSTGVDGLKRKIIDDLTGKAFDPANEPGVVPVIKRLQKMSGGNVTLQGLDSLRQVASNGWQMGKPSNNARLSEVINRIDELVDNADPTTLLFGNGKAAAEAMKEGRAGWHRARKLETVEKHVQRGEDIANSQVNADVSGVTKRQLRQIVTNDAKRRGFNAEELQALRTAAGYTPSQRILHAVGGMLPRDKLTSAIAGGIGVSTGGASIPFQLAGAGLGLAAGQVKDAASRKAVDNLVSLIATGKPLSTPKNAAQLLTEAKRDAIARLIMNGGVSAQ